MKELLDKTFGIIDQNKNVEENVIFLYENYNKKDILDHVIKVKNISFELSNKYDYDYGKAMLAALLHDISQLIKVENMIDVAKYYEIDILNEEYDFPILLHQKLSKQIAKDYFGLYDKEILDAIACHTTLRKNPSKLDIILLLSDKFSWDEKDKPSYFNKVYELSLKSLEDSIKYYLEQLIKNKESMKVLHTQTQEAYNYFFNKK